MTGERVLIYGAYGYTGRLVVAQALAAGLRPILGGRRAAPLVELAAHSDCEHRIFGLDSPAVLRAKLQDCAVLLHCAGPFADTARPMMDACLDSATHYLDVTGEIDVLEQAQRRDTDAHRAGVVLCPGVGFDVVPTDCIAATLINALPGADTLALGFDMDSALSPGTAKTVLRGLPTGGRIRRDGRIRKVPLAFQSREINFGRGACSAVSIPWGDVATAFYTTGIGNITCYVPLPAAKRKQLKRLNHLRWLLGLDWVQHMAARRIERRVTGPDSQARDSSLAYIWGEARTVTGDIRTARMHTANGYSVTAHAAVAVVQSLLSRPRTAGARTPATLMGADFASTLPGSSPITVS